MRWILRLTIAICCLGLYPARAALIIYYPLDETTGNVAFDATIVDGSQDATATDGGGLQFSPTGQTDVDEALIYNTPATTDSLLSAPPFTITVWFKSTNVTTLTQAAVYLGDRTQSAMYYAAGLAPGSYQPQLVARNTTAINTPASFAGNDGEWHQITAVFTATNDRTLYVDGRLAGSSATNVTHMILNRFGVGALTRSNQTDSFGGTLDEVGLFDTALSPQEAALLNAFPRYDQVRLDDSDYVLALSVFNTQTGSVNTGAWTWSYATGLPGTIGDTGFSGGNPYVILDSSGNGLAAVPEPGIAALVLTGVLGLMRWRQ
jgi:hypothetical protein